MQRRRLWILGTIAGAALLGGISALLAPASRTPPPRGDSASAAPAPGEPGPVVRREQAAIGEVTPAIAPGVVSEARVELAGETGAALALRYREAVCECTTKACRREVNAAFPSSAALTAARTPEEGQLIDRAFRDARVCIKRIHAAERAAAGTSL